MRNRYVVVGAGAVGATLAAELHRAGREVVLVARGEHLAVLRRQGLRYRTPTEDVLVPLPAIGDPEEVGLGPADVLVLATKTQDVEAAVARWAPQPVRSPDGREGTASALLPVVTLQNGLAAEDMVLRRFRTVVGGLAWAVSDHLEPGVVQTHAAPQVAALWLGCHPAGSSPRLEGIAADLRAARCAVVLVDDIRRAKAGKLLSNLTNALDALYAPSPLCDRVGAALRREARRVLALAGQEVADLRAEAGSAVDGFVVHAAPGGARGSSTWQSLTRGRPLEVDYLNGEVVLQARRFGSDAPLNAAVTEQAHRAAAAGRAPRSLGDDDLDALVEGLGTDLAAELGLAGERRLAPVPPGEAEPSRIPVRRGAGAVAPSVNPVDGGAGEPLG